MKHIEREREVGKHECLLLDEFAVERRTDCLFLCFSFPFSVHSSLFHCFHRPNNIQLVCQAVTQVFKDQNN